MPNALARMRVALPCVALLLFASTATAQGAVLRGSPKADHLTGTAGADTINGRGGRDRILLLGHDLGQPVGRGRADEDDDEDADRPEAAVEEPLHCPSP